MVKISATGRKSRPDFGSLLIPMLLLTGIPRGCQPFAGLTTVPNSQEHFLHRRDRADRHEKLEEKI